MFMNKTIYFHIGNHKTGTTSIQLILKKNIDLLNDNNLIYMDRSKNDIYNYNNNNISWELASDPRFNNQNKKLDDLIKLINSSQKNIIFSSEDFPLIGYNEKKMSLLLSALNTNKYKIKVIIYLRNQIDHFIGLYQISLLLGLSFSSPLKLINLLEKENIIKINSTFFWFDYFKQYNQILNLFKITKKDIICKSYHQEKEKLVISFFNCINKNIEKDLSKSDLIKTNSGLTNLQVKLIESTNFIGNKFNISSKELANIKLSFRNELYRIGSKYSIDDEMCNIIKNKFYKSNTKIEKLFNISINSYW